MSLEKKRMQELAGITQEGQEIETVNIAKKGDYIVKNPGGEEYVLTPEKFKKNYQATPISDKADSKGYFEYKNNPEKRDVLEVTKDLMNEIEREFKTTPSQKNFFDFCRKFETKKAQKNVKVKARIAHSEEKVYTLTKSDKKSEESFKFKASWGEDMILNVGIFLLLLLMKFIELEIKNLKKLMNLFS